MKSWNDFAYLGILLVQLSSGLFGHGVSAQNTSGRRLPPCQACRNLASSFLHGMEKTVKGHFGGGDTAWEEAKGLIYKESELRLAEIHETICEELSEGKDQCHELVGEHEDDIDTWWNEYRNAGKDLYTWLCIEQRAVCCPADHYGKDCNPCPGYPSNICSGHGKCKGNGTRKGNGQCTCDIGYAGSVCDSCAKDYYEAYNEGGKLICSACHKACTEGCTGAGTKHCNGCKPGWEQDDDLGCVDVNECLADGQICKINEFCVNTEGSYNCLQCDKSCDGCFGDGPDMCERCAEGYILKDKVCIDGSTLGKSVQMDMTRYLTYLGLCVATCIIFQKNVAIAAAVGVAVTIYISVSEYLLSTSGF